MQYGIYFRKETAELARVATGQEELPGDGWEHLIEKSDLRLVALRTLLVERGLVDEHAAHDVYWHMPQPNDDRDVTELLPAAA